MLESLDTLIAFVLIMLVVSLLITIVVQMAAAAFNLRGWNLLVGLKNTFAVIAPDTGEGMSRYAVINHQTNDQRKELARYLLKGGLLSDSFLPWWLTIWRHTSATGQVSWNRREREGAVSNCRLRNESATSTSAGAKGTLLDLSMMPDTCRLPR
jgi:hypothetical protein